jgi:hypothetical protein
MERVALLPWWCWKGGTSGKSSCCDGGSGIFAAAFGVDDGGGSDSDRWSGRSGDMIGSVLVLW